MGNLDYSHGGNIRDIRRKYGKEVIDFSANINPLGLSPEIKRTIDENVDEILHYPDSNATDLGQKIAEYWGISEKNVLLGNGSAELIYLITASFKPKTALIPIPTFSEYERASQSTKTEIRFLSLREKDGFRLNLSHLNKADIFFLCHPNNPTGNFILDNHSVIDELADKVVVVDEAFMDFLLDQRGHTSIWEAVKNRKIVVLRTFTKFFAIPGLRIGYLVAHQDTINKLRQHQPPWSINALAQAVAEAIFRDSEYISRTHRVIEKERRFLFDQLIEIEGIKPYPSVTNFLLIKIEKTGLTSYLLARQLIQKGILIRDCGNFRNLSNRYVRVAVRSRKENLKLIEALEEAL